MLPNWSRPESFWQSKWQDDRLGRQSKGSERSFWTASCYLLFLCRIIILRLFTPWTLIGIANADVQWLSIRIKDANNVKWGHVSKAAPFPRLFIAASSKENFIMTEAVLYLVSKRTAFTLQSLDRYHRFFFSKQHSWYSHRYQGCAAGLETLHYTKRGQLDWENYRQLLWFGAAISGRCTSNESSDRWSNNWRKSKMRGRNSSACEVRRLNETLTLQQDREEEDGRIGGWREGKEWEGEKITELLMKKMPFNKDLMVGISAHLHQRQSHRVIEKER